jgi:hypothetical protein|eukprot:SAG25_NODE_624_length_6384_cov_4.781066_1_plen_176_part_00
MDDEWRCGTERLNVFEPTSHELLQTRVEFEWGPTIAPPCLLEKRVIACIIFSLRSFIIATWRASNNAIAHRSLREQSRPATGCCPECRRVHSEAIKQSIYLSNQEPLAISNIRNLVVAIDFHLSHRDESATGNDVQQNAVRNAYQHLLRNIGTGVRAKVVRNVGILDALRGGHQG